MADPTQEAVLGALRTVIDPERCQDIVTLGMVSGLTIRDRHVLFALEVDPERGPQLEPLRVEAEAAVRKLPDVLSATAMLTAHRPAGGKAPAAPPQAARTKPTGRTIDLPGVGHIVAVASGKGGVGKSTVAANLAVGFVQNGLKVGLLDADIYGPSMPRMMGVGGKPTTPDGKTLDPKPAHGVQVMSIGFMVDEETPMIWRGPMVQSAITQMLRDVNWGDLDVLVVDMPPGTGDAQLTLAQSVPLSGAVIVSTPQDIALLDARKGLNMFRKVEVPVIGIIENMSYFCCPNCGHRSEIFGHGGARAEAGRLEVPFLGEVPLEISVRTTSDTGTPAAAAEPGGAIAAVFRDMAAATWQSLTGETAPRRAAPRIVMQ
ncbi:MAG: Mrp/NBP35 family ATP-binding protein [Rhodospirillaceae bacterium]|nr:Mrp/NBP35 family ATP-binding protein [Rhodospirillaceae bacterium]MCA8931360.1 Mrp/NBP35 family ATP-binding protein [Rhodospirillaceae bacterium]